MKSEEQQKQFSRMKKTKKKDAASLHFVVVSLSTEMSCVAPTQQQWLLSFCSQSTAISASANVRGNAHTFKMMYVVVRSLVLSNNLII